MAAAKFGPLLEEAEAPMSGQAMTRRPGSRRPSRSIGWRMLDDQAPLRLVAKSALSAGSPSRCRSRGPGACPEGRRNRPSRKVVEPLVGVFDDHDLDRVVAALGISLGTDSVLEVGQAIAIRHFEQPLCSGYLLHGTV